MPRTADTPPMTSTTPLPRLPRSIRRSATIAIVTYNRSGLLTRLLESITRMDPEARPRRDHRQRLGRRHDRARRVLPRAARQRTRLPPPGDQHGRLGRLQRGHAHRVRARLDVDLAHGRRRRGASRRPRAHGRVGAAVQEHPGPPLRLRRQRVLLAVPRRRAPRHPDPVRPGGLRRLRLQADELRMLRGDVHPPRHRRADRPARSRASSSTGTTRCTAGSPPARRRR